MISYGLLLNLTLIVRIRHARRQPARSSPTRPARPKTERSLPRIFPEIDNRFRGIVLGIFAALAVGLAMACVYGAMAYLVTQRASEIGLRMALGAGRAGIVRLVLARGAALTGAGLAVGLPGAMAATGLLRNMLFGVTATDPLTYGIMAPGANRDRVAGLRDSRLAGNHRRPVGSPAAGLIRRIDLTD